MRYILLAIMYCLQLSIANAQIINPGGVKGNLLWYIASNSANTAYFKSLSDLKNNLTPQANNTVSVSQFNFHPAILKVH
ncbi:hypothetical protein [Limnovirga soli]|uniref:hypothetical protein n=1 Tax=Limnovirga soli TaxID=2656915 RepID=UPI0014924A0C|nr:hypothetical protein [Limnovirga soli]